MLLCFYKNKQTNKQTNKQNYTSPDFIAEFNISFVDSELEW